MQKFNRVIQILSLGVFLSFSSLAFSADTPANANRLEENHQTTNAKDAQKSNTINAPYSTNNAGPSSAESNKASNAQNAKTAKNTKATKKAIAAKNSEILEEQTSAERARAKSEAITMMFPVNVARAKVNLTISIPQSFKPLNAITQQSTIYEFIPKKDKNPNKWSEIITISPLIGKKVSASAYRDSIINGIKQKAESAEVLEAKNEEFKNYQEASSIIQYKNQGREEVMILYVASGPYDLASVQYALPLKSANELDNVVSKLKSYVQENVQIQNF